MSITLRAIIPAYVAACKAFNEAGLIKYGNEWDTKKIGGESVLRVQVKELLKAFYYSWDQEKRLLANTQQLAGAPERRRRRASTVC